MWNGGTLTPPYRIYTEECRMEWHGESLTEKGDKLTPLKMNSITLSSHRNIGIRQLEEDHYPIGV